MRITEFKEGDIITRNEPVTYAHNGSKDSSYCGERLVFHGVDQQAKVIVFTGRIFDTPSELSYARDAWDEGWAYFPETLWEKAKKFIE